MRQLWECAPPKGSVACLERRDCSRRLRDLQTDLYDEREKGRPYLFARVTEVVSQSLCKVWPER